MRPVHSGLEIRYVVRGTTSVSVIQPKGGRSAALNLFHIGKYAISCFQSSDASECSFQVTPPQFLTHPSANWKNGCQDWFVVSHIYFLLNGWLLSLHFIFFNSALIFTGSQCDGHYSLWCSMENFREVQRIPLCPGAQWRQGWDMISELPGFIRNDKRGQWSISHFVFPIWRIFTLTLHRRFFPETFPDAVKVEER